MDEVAVMRRLLGLQPTTDIELIKDSVSLVTSVPVEDLKKKSRRGEIVMARAILGYIATKDFGMTSRVVANELGLDSSCIRHHALSIQDRLDVKSVPETGYVKQIRELIKNVQTRQENATVSASGGL